MKCEMNDRDQRIDNFLLKKLSPEDTETFEIHLFGCPECLAELRLREQMLALIKEERVTAVAERRSSSSRQASSIRAIADFLRLQQNVWVYAGAVVMVFIGFFLIPRLLRQETPNMDVANFVEAPALESKLGQALRSAEVSLSILAPKIGDNFTGEIIFIWEIEKDGEKFDGPLELKILDNRENPVYAATVANGKYHFNGNLTPGLYYWALDDNGETLYLGKFFVKKPAK